jgi:protein-L-isoaspartate(D-aspartate) O-methyltransferase
MRDLQSRRKEREEMVQRQLADRGFGNERVLDAMRWVPREAFVPPELAARAYDDAPLPIAKGQTISQPYVVALMAEAVDPEPSHRILEIGTGSGYAAVLGRVAGEVYTIERHGALADAARARLERLSLENVHVRHGDGSEGWPEHAPYDGIVVTAGAIELPEALPRQRLLMIRRLAEDRFGEESLGDVSFVPLVAGVQTDWCSFDGSVLRDDTRCA